MGGMRQENPDAPAIPTSPFTTGIALVLCSALLLVPALFLGWLTALAPIFGSIGDRSDFVDAAFMTGLPALLVGFGAVALRRSIPTWAFATMLGMAAFVGVVSLSFVSGAYEQPAETAGVVAR
jgi:hypothetical protein